MPYMTWAGLLNSPQPTSAGTALASSTSLTDVSVAPQFTLPANFLQAGSALRFTAFGVFSTTGTPTLLLGIYFGGVAGTALAATTAFTTPSGVTNVPWRLELTSVWRTIGASGTAMSQGFLQYGSSVSALQATLPVPQIALATVATDTTAAKTLTVGAQWGTSSASNTLTLHGFQIESMGA
jgi:hypothetical protein